MRDKYAYNIHDIITVNSEAWLPELASFRVGEPVDQPTVSVHIGKANQDRPHEMLVPDGHRILYDEGLGPVGFTAEIIANRTIGVWVSRLVGWSRHVLYTNVVEPILRWVFVDEGYALVHGACLAFGSGAHLVTGRTDTGKTTTLLRILSNQQGTTFISDDLTLVRPDGLVLTYPKPLTISLHTVNAINPEVLSPRERLALLFQSRVHSRPSRRLALHLAQTRLPMATINAVVQWLVPPPKYHVERLIPGVGVTRESHLAGLFVIERGGEGQIQLEPEEAIDIVFKNCEDAYGFPPYHAFEGFLCTLGGRDLRAVERQIVTRALRNCPAVLLRSNNLDWWQRIPALANESVGAE